MTRREVLKKIEECEKNEEFDKHVDPIDFSLALPVDENFRYLHKKFPEAVKIFFQRMFCIAPFCRKLHSRDYLTKIYGKENLKNLKGAVVVCNHVNKFDCLVAKYGFSPRTLYITGAQFNNQKGFMGEMIRAGHFLPFSDNFTAQKNLDRAISVILKKGKYVLFYPEQAMWWNYRKPRPFKDGAFYYAVKNNVPVVPTFITFCDQDKIDEEGLPKQQFNYFIMPPIIPKKELGRKENIEYLKTAAHQAWVHKYEQFYGEKLAFSNGDKENI